MTDMIASLIVEISTVFQKNKRFNRTFLFVSIISASVGFGLLIYFLFTKDYVYVNNYFNQFMPLFIVPSAIYLLLTLVNVLSKYKGPLEIQLDRLHTERHEITSKIEEDNDRKIFNTIQLSLNQLTEYYSINKAQARSSFGLSIFAIILGLITIISGIWMFYLKSNPNISLTMLTGVAGLLLEFIGGAYFFMYKKSLEQVNFFFGQLIKIQDTMLSIDLAKNIGSNDKQIEMTEKIIISLLERSLK